MNSRPVLASLLCASLASLAPASAHAQLSPAGLSAAGQLATALAWQAEPINTSVLGLRSDDAKGGAELTKALRKAFADREMSGGQELTLEEVILTLDCSSEEDTACMTEAGRALETERLVYGTLTAGTLMIDVLDVTSGQIEANVEMPLDEVDLAPENIDATAAEVVNSLYPQSDPAVIAATPTGDDITPGEEPKDDIEDEPGSDLVWGAYKPRPTWKKVGLGISAGLAVAGIATSITGWVIYKQRWEPEVKAAQTRNGDGGGDNTLAYCRRIEREDENAPLNSDGQREVADPDRSEACEWFLGGRRANVIGTSVAVVAGAATVVFAVLHFVHRDKGPKANARKRTFRVSGGPMPGGGVLGGYGRF